MLEVGTRGTSFELMRIRTKFAPVARPLFGKERCYTTIFIKGCTSGLQATCGTSEDITRFAKRELLTSKGETRKDSIPFCIPQS